MSINLNDFIGASGEIVFAVGFVLLLLWDVIAPRGNRTTLAWMASLLFVVAAGVSIVIAPEGIYFSGTFKVDLFSQFLKLFAAGAGILSIWIALPRFAKSGEYYLLLSAIVFGMFIIAGANDFVLLIVGLETVSIPSYILTGYYRLDKLSGEAALKYVLFGAVSIGAMLFGFSYLYGITGETNYDMIREVLMGGAAGYELVLFVAMLLMMTGFGYKIAAVPFHFWCPDVYQGSPTPMTAFFSVAPKAAGLYALTRFLATIVPPNFVAMFGWDQLFWWIAVATMTLGNLAALPQTNLKRLLAYSSIAQAGYLLTVFVVNSAEGYIAMMFYLVAYLFMNLGAFAIVEWIERSNGSVDLAVYRGLGKRDPKTAVLLSIFLFSLAGIPPLAGFIGKFLVFSALLDKNQTVLALIAVINTVVSVVYYVKIVREMFLVDSEHETVTMLPTSTSALLLVCAVPTLVLGIFFSPLVSWVSLAINSFYANF
ncbi:MAG: NADH-quinone oxidoreductase subunit N [bacterium]|nr:NADH-quinone oxidoreductase subunit N [bacterium]